MDNIAWIVVADAESARVFATLTDSTVKDNHIEINLNLLDSLDHHSHKAHEEEFGTFVKGSDPKEANAAHFAQYIAFYLEKGRNAHKYASVVIVASPHFMGLLNQHISKEVEKLITTKIEKDYTSENEKVLADRLKTQLKP